MKEVLGLRRDIVNGPLPPSELWQVLAEVIMRDMECIEPSAFPTSEEYSKFVLVPPTSQLAATMQAEVDLEDDPELRNEVSMLEWLEVRMDAVAATDNPDGASSGHPMPNDATTQVIEDSESSSDEDADSTDGDDWNGNIEGVDDVYNRNGEDAVHGAVDGIQKRSESPVDEDWEINEFWMNNARPKSLPSIKTIIEAVHFPAQTYDQQKPTTIWQEFMKLHIPGLSARVCTIPCSLLPTRLFPLGGKRPTNLILQERCHSSSCPGLTQSKTLDPPRRN